MNEYDDLGKDVEITISFNEFMKILKVYDEVRVRRDFPCQIDDELYYPSLTWACFSMVLKGRLKESKKETDDLLNGFIKLIEQDLDNSTKLV